MFFWKQGKRVEELVNRHLALVDAALRSFQDALDAYLDGTGEVEALAKRVHEHESRADDVRREVLSHLLHGALMGSYREDMLSLVEQADLLANSADALIENLVLQRIRIPEALTDPVREICAKSMNILDEIHQAVRLMFKDMRGVLEHTRRIEKLEGEIDQLEKRAIQELFGMPLELAEKLWVRDFVTHLAQLSDRAEDLSDLIEIIVAKRRV